MQLKSYEIQYVIIDVALDGNILIDASAEIYLLCEYCLKSF